MRLDSHTLGNFLKNASPAAALVPGVGVLGAGLLSTAGGLARGENLDHAAIGGVENAALGGGLASLAGHVGIGSGAHLGFGLGGGGEAAAATPEVNTPGLPGPSSMASGLTGATSAPNAGLSALKVAATPGSPGGFASRALGFAESHPNAIGLGLQGVGSGVSAVQTGPSDRRLRSLQGDLIQKQLDESDYDFQQRKARDLALAPAWSALANAVGNGTGYSNVAKNPYLPAGA